MTAKSGSTSPSSTMGRVMIVGAPGSGKSTLARALGERTGLPVFHMDHIHWKSGWVERTQDEKIPMVLNIQSKPSWILEGGHSRTYADRIARADTFIWLDVALPLRVFRVLRRSYLYRGRTRPDLPEGCPEQFNRQTLEFLGFIWRTRHTSRAQLNAIFQDPPAHLKCYRLTRLSDVNRFLANLPA